MLYVHKPTEVAYHCVNFIINENERNGCTNFKIELFEKESKLDRAFKFVRISGDSCSTEFATGRFAWVRAEKLLRKSRWRLTNTRYGEGISVCVSI